MTEKPLTIEQKLTRIIEAQAKGGYDVYEEYPLNRMTVWNDGLVEANEFACMDRRHVLEILLDREGLRAAYSSASVAYGVSFHRPGEFQKSAAFTLGLDADSFLGRRIPDSDGAWTETPEWLAAAQDILHAWLSGGAEAAIQTAFDLLV